MHLFFPRSNGLTLTGRTSSENGLDLDLQVKVIYDLGVKYLSGVVGRLQCVNELLASGTIFTIGQ